MEASNTRSTRGGVSAKAPMRWYEARLIDMGSVGAVVILMLTAWMP